MTGSTPCCFFGSRIQSASQNIKKNQALLEKHGVHIERWLMTQEMAGNGLERPDQIVVTWFSSADANALYDNDSQVMEVAKIRNEAAKVVTLTGTSVFGD